MIATDIVLIAALAVFVLAWWVRRTPRRPMVLLIAALVALAAGAAGVLDDRWQAGAGVVVAALLLLVLLVNRLRNTDRREGVPFVSGPVFTLLVAGAIAAIVLFPVTHLPKPSGKLAVGVRTFEVTDASRKGVFHAKADEPRRLLVRIWYPAGDVAGLKTRPYFTQIEADTTARSLGALLKFPPFFTYLKHVGANSYEDAPLAPGLARAPVVIYSHGYTSFLGQNTALMEELASHGYVVFSLQHTFDSAATVFPNGDVAPQDPKLIRLASADPGPRTKAEIDTLAGAALDDRLTARLILREKALKDADRLTQSGEVWAADRIFLHDQLQAGAVPAEVRPILAASDLTRVGEMGMSFGGATAGTVCMRDKRCAAGINLDGGDFPFYGFDAAMPVPFLMFHSDMANMYKAMGVEPKGPTRGFNEFSYEPIASAGTRADVYRVQLKGAQHLGLSDLSLFMRRPVRDPILGSTPAAVMIGAQNDFVRGFFDHHLRGMANGFPKPQLAAYGDWILPASNADIPKWWAAKSQAERAALAARIAAVKPVTARPPPPS